MNKDFSQAWRREVTALCQCSGVAVLTPVACEPSAWPCTPKQVRLFDIRADESIVVEQPELEEHTVAQYVLGTLLRLLVVDGDQRLEGVCELVEAYDHSLDDRRTIPALLLGPAQQVQSAQRRAFFRVDTVGVPLVDITMIAVSSHGDDDIGDSLLLDATLENISGSGIGVNVPLTTETLESLRRCRYWQCVMYLPTVKEPIELRARVIHINIGKGDTAYLGLAFDGTDDVGAIRAEDQIVRFSTWLQREQLRRQRRA